MESSFLWFEKVYQSRQGPSRARFAVIFIAWDGPAAEEPLANIRRPEALNKALRPTIFHDKMSKVALCLRGSLRPRQV